MQNPAPGRIVRVVTSLGSGIPHALFAHVLTVAPIEDANLGANGEPTISVAYLDDPNRAVLGKVDWHQEFARATAVRHFSHPDVLKRLTSICWVDVVDDSGGPLTLAALPRELFFDPTADNAQQQAGSPMPSDPTLQIEGHHGIAEVPAAAVAPTPNKVAVDCIAMGAPLSSDGEVDIIVDGKPKSVTLGSLNLGDELAQPFFAKVRKIEPTQDGVTYITTEPVGQVEKPATPTAADLDAHAADEAAKDATTGTANLGGPPPEEKN